MKNLLNRDVYGCIDTSPLGIHVARYAAWIARSVDAKLVLLNSVEPDHRPKAQDLSGAIGLGVRDNLIEQFSKEEHVSSKAHIQAGREALERAKSQIQEGLHVETLQRHGDFYETLISLQERIRILVFGIRGEEAHEGLGSQVEEVLRSLNAPVLLINGAFKAPQKVLLAYDGSDNAKEALDMISEAPLFRTLEVHVAYVGESRNHILLDEALKRLQASGINAQSVLLQGVALTALLDYQRKHEIDLVAMGAFGHGRLRSALFGSFTEKMIRSCGVPLLLLLRR